MKKAFAVFQLVALLLTCPMMAEKTNADLVRTLCAIDINSNFFPQMVLKNFLDKHKECEPEVFTILPKLKDRMFKDKYYETMICVFKDFTEDEFDLYMTLKKSDFMKKVQAAEKHMEGLKLPTYEKEILSMINEKNINNLD